VNELVSKIFSQFCSLESQPRITHGTPCRAHRGLRCRAAARSVKLVFDLVKSAGRRASPTSTPTCRRCSSRVFTMLTGRSTARFTNMDRSCRAACMPSGSPARTATIRTARSCEPKAMRYVRNATCLRNSTWRRTIITCRAAPARSASTAICRRRITW
jgi:hypothetical protein